MATRQDKIKALILGTKPIIKAEDHYGEKLTLTGLRRESEITVNGIRLTPTIWLTIDDEEEAFEITTFTAACETVADDIYDVFNDTADTDAMPMTWELDLEEPLTIVFYGIVTRRHASEGKATPAVRVLG